MTGHQADEGPLPDETATRPRRPRARPTRPLRRVRLGLLLNALRWRAGSSVVFFTIAVLAVAAATAGPVYLAAANQSVLDHVLIPSSVQSTGLVAFEEPGQSMTQAAFRSHFVALPRSPSGRRYFGQPIYTAIANAEALAPSGAVLDRADFVARSLVCRHVVFSGGSCPNGPNQLAVSTRSAALLHVGVGSVLHLSVAGTERVYRVAGLYRAGSASAAYWWGTNFFRFGSAIHPPPLRLDALFVNPSAFAGLVPDRLSLNADVPVDTRNLVATEVPAFRATLAAVELRLGRAGLLANSQIDGLLNNVTTQQQAMTTTIAVIDLQLLLLVLMVLFGIAGRTAAERDQDLALADLRGLSSSSLWAVALREPFVLMLAATPVGAALGWLVALLISRSELLPGVPVRFDSLALAAAAIAAVAALVATAAGSRRVLRRQSGQQLPGRSRLGTTLALAGEAFVVALAVAAVVQLSASGVGNAVATQPLAALAPGLIALAAGVIAARLVPLVCRGLGAVTRFSPRVGFSLAFQRVARQSGIIRQSVIIAIAVALACFAVVGFQLDGQNRSIESAFLVGANRVLTVSVPSNVDFVKAVRLADPSGRLAMASQVESGSTGTVLAVDSSRFAQVVAWTHQPGSPTAAVVARYLAPPVAPDVTVEGSALRLDVDLRAPVSPRPSLVLQLFNEQYGAMGSFTIGPLVEGRHTYVTQLQGVCTSVCRLESIALSWPGPEGATSDQQAGPTTVPVVIEHIDEQAGGRFRPVPAGLTQPRHWRVSQSAPGNPSSLSTSPSGLVVGFKDVLGQPEPAVAPADTPEPLPAVVTDTVVSVQSSSGPTGSTRYSVVNLDGSSLNVNGAVQVAALPAVGSNAVMVDLNSALRSESLADYYSNRQVWLSSAAGSGATVISRLGAEHIRVLSVQTARSRELAFKQDGPTLAFELFVVVGLASALLATGSLLFAVAVVTRQRSVEAVALHSVGVPRRTLVGAMAGELGIVAATGLVAGALAGTAAARFSLPSVPEFTGLPPGPTLVYTLPVASLLAVVGAAALLLSVAIAVSITMVNSASTPDKLRISQR